MTCKVEGNRITCTRGENLGTKEICDVIITGCDKKDWYDELIGKRMKVTVYRNEGAVQSVSLGEWIKNGHFKIIRGKDVRKDEVKIINN